MSLNISNKREHINRDTFLGKNLQLEVDKYFHLSVGALFIQCKNEERENVFMRGGGGGGGILKFFYLSSTKSMQTDLLLTTIWSKTGLKF